VVGIQYLTASGSPEKAVKARTRFINMAIGLIVYVAIFGIFNFLMPMGKLGMSVLMGDSEMCPKKTTTEIAVKVPIEEELPRGVTPSYAGTGESAGGVGDIGDSVDTETDEEGDESVTTTVNNTCGAAKVSTGKTYGGVKNSSSVVAMLGRAINKISGGDTAHTRAYGSYLLIRYERQAGASASESGLSSWLTREYQATVTGYVRSVPEPTDAMKTVIAYLMTSGTRVLPASTVEMLSPKKVSLFKIDGTDANRIKGTLISDAQLSQLHPGVTTGKITGYKEELKFFCGIKNGSGGYSYLFWQRDNTPAGQETK
jgi:hypothetical protein